MRQPQDCTYPHTRLCVHGCDDGCMKKNFPMRAPATRKEREDAEAEDEAFKRVKPILTCNQLGVCQDRKPPCPNCPNR